MRSVIRELRHSCQRAVEQSLPESARSLPICKVDVPRKSSYDYVCPTTAKHFALLKAAGKASGTVYDFTAAAGQHVVAATEFAREAVDTCGVEHAGLLGIRLRTDFLARRVLGMVREGEDHFPGPAASTTGQLSPETGLPRRVIIDYSSPNIAKEMHVGHLRSTLLGDSLARLLEYHGHSVQRVNHLGDWGTQFGMLLAALQQQHGARAVEEAEGMSISGLQELYQLAKRRFDEEPDFKKQALQEVVRLQGGNPDSLALWKAIRATSLREFESLYSRLGIAGLQARGESFYNPSLPNIVAELKAQGIAEASNGATILPVEGYSFPLILQKSDGGFTYDTTDLAAIRHRVQDLGGEWLLYVTDAGQKPHFDLVFSGAEKAGWLRRDVSPADELEAAAERAVAGSRGPRGVRLDHVGFGVVTTASGKRMKTREGDTFRLADLLDEAREHALRTLETRTESELGSRLDPTEFGTMAEDLAIAAVKYFDLRHRRMSNYKFSVEDTVDLKGNTAVYLQYAHARICQLFAKAKREAGVDAEELIGNTLASPSFSLRLEHPSERALALEIVRIHEALESSLHHLEPHFICEYAYSLAGAFADFYRKCHVVRLLKEPAGSSDYQTALSRLVLCQATIWSLRFAFRMLGFQPQQRL